MLLDFYAAFFRTYKAVFQPHIHEDGAPQPQCESPDSQDKEATLLGDAYRGSGVLVGILGALIIFCAVAPVGFGLLGRPAAIYFGIAEVGLMVWVWITIKHVRDRAKLKENWIAARKAAEEIRYRPLMDSIDGDFAMICKAVESKLNGSADCQIKYNHEKRSHYHTIEHRAASVTTIGFGISLLAAIAHLIFHADALIFLTAALPAAVAALHGVNGFLHLEELSQDHERMAKALEACRDEFARARAANDLEAARALARKLYGLLVGGLEDWQTIAHRLELKEP